jgi:hypothetical protein
MSQVNPRGGQEWAPATFLSTHWMTCSSVSASAEPTPAQSAAFVGGKRAAQTMLDCDKCGTSSYAQISLCNMTNLLCGCVAGNSRIIRRVQPKTAHAICGAMSPGFGNFALAELINSGRQFVTGQPCINHDKTRLPESEGREYKCGLNEGSNESKSKFRTIINRPNLRQPRANSQRTIWTPCHLCLDVSAAALFITL